VVLPVSCMGGPEVAPPVALDNARTAAEIRSVLDSICSRTDGEAAIARARGFTKIRELEGGASPTLLAQGDSADMDVLSIGGLNAPRAESAGRLARHYRDRAEDPALSRSAFPGPMGETLRRIVLLTISSYYAELSTRQDRVASLERLSRALSEFARKPGLSPQAVKLLMNRAIADGERAAQEATVQGEIAPGADALKFCDADVARHLEEGTRAADLGTREKADRADVEGVLNWYLLALAHYGVVRETVTELTPAQEHALDAQEIVVRSLCDLLCREP
jgi:hypothetical protein